MSQLIINIRILQNKKKNFFIHQQQKLSFQS